MISFIQAAAKALNKSPDAAMTTNKYLKHQVNSWMADHPDHLDVQPQTPSLNNLPDCLLATILSYALPERRAGFTSSIMDTTRMFKKTATARPTPGFLLVNKKFNRVGKQVWAQTDFCHIYINSWNPFPCGLVTSISAFPFVVMTLDIRRGERALGQKLVPSAIGAKLRVLLKEMKHLEALLLRVWHGIGSLGPVSEIIMNNFSSVRVAQAVNIASIVSVGGGIDEDRGCPGLLSESYMENFLSHLLHLPLKQVPKPTTAYLDESEPALKIPIWRGCAAAHESVNSAWLPVLEQPVKTSEDHEDGDCTDEEDETLAELFKVKMMEIPWVKAAARTAKKQEKVRNKGKNKQVSGEKRDV